MSPPLLPSLPLADPSAIEVAIEVELPEDEPPGQAVLDPESRSSRLCEEIRRAVQEAAGLRGFFSGRIGVLVTDDETIREINRRHLEHDYATDVISFTYSRSASVLEGELVVSLDTARAQASDFAWGWNSELLLYVIHGTLHIGGLEDGDPRGRAEMRLAERQVLARLGLVADTESVRAGRAKT
ncbi:MAG: rRNA maturation RNase YbeY [Planctomycetaceae bacterium]|nr:MAG: rRNA maturation RNase YbeY [Planctomycetaceae bacterium]